MTTSSTRRTFLAGTAAAAAVGAAAGCSFDKTAGGGGSDGGGDGAKAFLNVNSFGPRPTFIENFNPFSPTDGVIGSNYLYDTLGYADVNNKYEIVPWLAQSIDFDPEARTATVTLRDDATWSDGEKITTADLVYTVMELPAQAEKQKATVTSYDFEVAAVDDLVATVSWSEETADISGDRTLAAVPLYPKHVFSTEDLATFTNADPVTSSPLVVDAFTPQRVSFAVREDHFMGAWDHIGTVNWTPYGSAEIGKSMVLQGTMDMATLSLQNAEDTIVAKGNHYWTVELVGTESLIFNTAKAPLDDRNVRRAIYAALDTDQIHSLFDIGLASTSPTTMDEKIFGEDVVEEYRTPHAADQELAKKLLADGGWTVEGGKLVKDGTSYPVSFKTVADYVNWSTWSDGVKAQLKEVLGLDVAVLKIPDAQIWDQFASGEFEIGMNWVGGGPHLSAVYADFHSKNAAPIGEAGDGNYGRVENPELDELLDASRVEYDETKLLELSQQMQKIVVEEGYCGPFNASASFLEASGKNFEGFPQSPLGEGDIIPRPYGPEGWQTMAKLKPIG
ncbi:ABC transporter substrate-binding protein [Brachybacterium tyrofermentans]|uniref:ABC transporter substrate-binding protein n=1 Tax=Brachybacterium tyrofermentans TaxID=47848 RepID=A0ABW0FJ45_9MICO